MAADCLCSRRSIVDPHDANCPYLATTDEQADRIVDRITENVKHRQKGFEALTREQSKQLLEFFMYRLGGKDCDLREQVAATLPQAYNAWCGTHVVKVVSTNDPTREWTA